MDSMTVRHYDFIPWLLIVVAPVFVAIWPFGRGRTRDIEPEEQAPTESHQADPVIDHMDWGIRLGMLGKFARAAERFEQAAATDPEDASAHYNFGLAMDQVGDHERARDAYARAIEIDPRFADAHTNLAIAQHALGDDKAAIDSLGAALEIDSTNTTARFDLACIHASLGDLDKAIPEYEAALKADPKDAGVRFNLAVAYGRVGRNEDAERELKDFLVLARTRFPRQREYAARVLARIIHDERG